MKLLVHYGIHPKPVSTAWLRRISTLVIKSVKGGLFEKRAELSVVLTGDGEVRKLNRLYRKKDKTTDVLSFPLMEGMKIPRRPKDTVSLGDVVISVPQTRRQARQQAKDFREELALLLTHGILHLLGYDHVGRAKEKKMFGLQDRLLKKWKA